MNAARALVAGRDDPDPGPFERVEQAEERLAGNREGVPDAGRAEGVGDEPADGPRPGVGHRLEVGGSRWSAGTAGVGGVGRLGGASTSSSGSSVGVIGRRRCAGIRRRRLADAVRRSRRARRCRLRRLGRLRRVGSSASSRRSSGCARSACGCGASASVVGSVERVRRRARSWRLRSFGSVGPGRGGRSAVVLELERDWQIELARVGR